MSPRPGSQGSSLRVGDTVRCERAEPAKGTWSRYAGREGTVIALNRERFPNGTTYVEVGVSFSRSHAATWFRADEVVLVRKGTGATRRSERRNTASGTETVGEP